MTSMKCSVVLVCLAVVSFTLSVFTLFIFVAAKNDSSTNDTTTGAEENPIICIPCEKLKNGANPKELYDALKKTKDSSGLEHCCAQTADHAEGLVRTITSELTRNMKMKKPDETKTAFAQKSLCVEQREANNGASPTSNTMAFLKIDPSRHDPSHEVVQGVNITDQGLQIVTGGHYFVYKNLNFLAETIESCKKLEDKTFISYIVRNDTKTKNVLLKTEHKCCLDCPLQSETGFVGGTFYLNKADVIQVEVSGLNHINLNKDVTYMGVIMLQLGR